MAVRQDMSAHMASRENDLNQSPDSNGELSLLSLLRSL